MLRLKAVKHRLSVRHPFGHQQAAGVNDHHHRKLPLRQDRFSRRRRYPGTAHLLRLILFKAGGLWAYDEPLQFQLIAATTDDAKYHWQNQLAAHHFCPMCGCGTYSDSPAFAPDRSWDKVTPRIGVNARLFNGFDAATASVTVIDGKHLW